MSNLLTRLIVGFIYITVIVIGSMYSPLLFIGLISLFAFLCLLELIKILRFDNILYIIGAFLIGAYLLYTYGSGFWYSTSIYELNLINLLPIFLFGIAILLIFKRTGELYYDSSKLIFSVVYGVLPFALIFAVVNKIEVDNFQSFNALICLFILLWCSDSFAYITGRLFGSTPLSKISAKKTVEGLVGGIFFTIVAGVIMNYNLTELRGNWIIIAALVAIAAPVGDLAESKLKRFFDIKDSSNWLPGHGGYLDRLDSFLTSAVVVYTYYLFI
ncbi:phosphatidate cytidylyltransferase [Flavobacteriaceae bacterium Ap0902]|nr:phosphatidate cytidylyltransferase [Flavobacteriaceae bacterium Ap0902]